MIHRKRRRKICLAAIFISCLIFYPSIYGAARMKGNLVSKRQLKDLLPEELKGWQRNEEIRFFNRSNIFDYMDGGGEFYLAYDFTDLLTTEYRKNGGNYPVTLEIYRLAVSQDAYGVFHHDLEGEKPQIGKESIYAKGFFKGWQNNIFIRIVAMKETPEIRQFILNLAEYIFKNIPAYSLKPEILTRLPKDYMISDSVRYFHKYTSLNSLYFLATTNILQLSGKTQAALAQYKIKDAKVKVIIIEYPSKPKAKEAYLSFNQAYLPENPDLQVLEKIQAVEQNQFVGVKLINNYIYLIFEAKNQDFIKAVFISAENNK